MAERKKLTKRVIDALTYTGSVEKNERCVVMDTELTGFAIRVYPSGKKTFIVRYKNTEGRDRLKTLGEFGPLTVVIARQQALSLLGQVVEGADPVEAERTRRVEGMTFSELGDIFVKEWSQVRNRSWEFDRDRLERHLKPALGSRRADNLTVRDLSLLHRKIGAEHPFEANRVRALSSAIFNYGLAQGLLPRGFENPLTRIVPFDEPERDRVVNFEEMPRLWASIEQEQNPYVRAAFKLAFLTATRKSEILNLRWENVDLDENQIYLPETKNGRAHFIPLSSTAVAIIESLEKRDGNPFVLCGRVVGRPLTTWTKRWNVVKKRARLLDVQPRDLRRTHATWLAELGHGELTIAHLLNHKIKGVTGVYIKLSKVPDEVRRAVEAVALKLAEELVRYDLAKSVR